MIIGRPFEDATCLRVAAAFETLTGGFPAPPADAPAGSPA
jgi:amidase